MSFLFALFIAAGSGFVALSYEIVWYRAYAFVSQASPAAFGLLLGAYLFGLAGGSLGARYFCRDREAAFDPKVLRSLALFVFLANAVSFLVVPGLALYGSIVDNWPGSLFLVGLAAGLLGATLPLVAHFGIAPDDQAGARLSYVYLANILGSVAGSLLTGFVLFDHLSLPHVDVVLASVGFVLAGVVLAASRPVGRERLGYPLLAAIAAALLLAGPRLHQGLYEKLLWGTSWQKNGPFAQVIENRHGVIAVSKDATVYGGGAYDGRFNTSLVDDRNWVIRAYGLAGMHAAPKRVLMIGLSSGSWAQIIVNMPGVESVTAVEINSGYLELIGQRDEVKSLLTNPKFKVDIDDGRRWLRKHPDERFDLVVMNTSFHYRAHMTNLLSREYLEMVRTHLSPGGILFYNTTSSGDVIKTAVATFPHALRFYNFMAVSDAPFTVDKARWETALTSWSIDGQRVFDLAVPAQKKRLDEVLAVADTLGGKPAKEGLEDGPSLRRNYAGATVVTDDNMRCEWWSPSSPLKPILFD
jgi:spermidine synthase